MVNEVNEISKIITKVFEEMDNIETIFLKIKNKELEKFFNENEIIVTKQNYVKTLKSLKLFLDLNRPSLFSH
jgi:hypothetical protein